LKDWTISPPAVERRLKRGRRSAAARVPADWQSATQPTRDGLVEAERGGDENASRSSAHARDIGGAADDHLNVRCFSGGRFFRRFGIS
jgi:hypothetical protein